MSFQTHPRSLADNQEFTGKTSGCIKKKGVLPGTVYIWRDLAPLEKGSCTVELIAKLKVCFFCVANIRNGDLELVTIDEVHHGTP